jgi:3-oxoadipate enol-lactonase
MPKVKTGKIQTYYEIHGKGEPLVFIPGAGSSLEGFYRHVPVYAKEYRVILYDPRGAGRTEAPDVPYTTATLADDLAGLLDAIGAASAHLFGASMGGMVAQEFALRYPLRTMSLILACTKFGGPHEIPVDAEVLAYWQNPKQLSPQESIRESFRFTMSKEFVDNNPELIKQIIEKSLNNPPPAAPHNPLRQVEAILSHDTYGRLPEIKAPTLVIHGDADRMSPVENGRILAARIPNSELVILKGMGHGFTIEAFEESNRIMLGFLKRHSKSGKK